MKKQRFLIYPIFLSGIFLIILGSCKKDNDKPDDDTIEEIHGSFTDGRDGNVYKTIAIGTQVWMAENLRYLPSVSAPGNGSETTSHYYVYNYDETNVNIAKATSEYETYGVLYNWTAAMAGSASGSGSSSNIQGVCPAGWHLPSHAEWQRLVVYSGGPAYAGHKLKEAGSIHWSSPNEGATNESGFTALPGGYCDASGSFWEEGICGYWWSATEHDTHKAFSRQMYYDLPDVGTNEDYKKLGLSVRCVKN